MQRLPIVLWILATTSGAHAQSSDPQREPPPPSQQVPRSTQEPPHEAPPLDRHAVPAPATPQLPEAPVSRSRKLAGVGLVAGGAVAVGIGLIVGAGARSTYGEVKALCGDDLVCDTGPTFERGQQLVSDARWQATISTVAVVAGGAAVVTGLVVWLTAPRERQTETTRVVPIVTHNNVALAIAGRF